MRAHRRVIYHYQPLQNAYSYSAPVRINSLGFRGPEWKKQKTEGVVRIACLGDSFTFGIGANEDKTYPALLEKSLNVKGKIKCEVYNFGVNGYDLAHELKVLDAVALEYSPDVVVLNFFPNDLFESNESYEMWEAKCRDQARQLRSYKWKAFLALRKSRIFAVLWTAWNRRLIRDMESLLTPYLQGQDPRQGSGAKLWQVILKRMEAFQAMSRTAGFQPVLVLIPAPLEIQQLKDGKVPSYHRFLADFAQELSMVVIDPLPAFAQAGPLSKLLIPYDQHLNERGNEILAAAVASSLKPLPSRE